MKASDEEVVWRSHRALDRIGKCLAILEEHEVTREGALGVRTIVTGAMHDLIRGDCGELGMARLQEHNERMTIRKRTGVNAT